MKGERKVPDMNDSMQEVKVFPPTPGACKVCATEHAPGEPHDRDSLFYQNRFYRKYRRLPTWEDAMAHCSQEMKEEFIKRLERRGIFIE